MREYRPSNHVPPAGLLLLITTAVAGGLGAGVITYFVSREVYLIILFPILLGLGVGWIMAMAVQIGKVRAPLVAGAFGVVMALILYGTYRYAEYYWRFRSDFKRQVEKTFGQKITDDEYQRFEDITLQDEVGAKGFAGYIRLTAREGIMFTRATSSSDSGVTLKGTVLYLYWMLEIAAIGFFAAVGAARSARKPFSEQSGEWYGKAARVGTLPAELVSTFVERVQQGQLAQAGALVTAEARTPPRTDVAVYRSAAPGTDHLLAVQRVTLRRSSADTKDLHRWIITPAEFETLRTSLTGPSEEI
jgi:hypothetical protein